MIKNSIKDSIKEYFFIRPTAKLRVREIERELGLPLPSVIRYCKELEKEGLLTTVKLGRVIFYTGDRVNSAYVIEKRLFNVRSIYASGIVAYLKEMLHNPVVVLFGSYALGEDTETSDIDLYVETPSKKEIRVENFEKVLKRNIQLFRYASIRKVNNVYLANNIINGIKINGVLEVFT